MADDKRSKTEYLARYGEPKPRVGMRLNNEINPKSRRDPDHKESQEARKRAGIK